MANHAEENSLYLPSAENHRAVGGDPEVRIYLGRWRLAADEALLIELQPPECDYWNFQLANVWAESFDYRFEQVHINSGNATYNDDGTVTLLIAADHPHSRKHANWISTAHHDHGIMGVRWVRANAECFGIDPGSLGLFGSSSGGHLVLCAAKEPPRATRRASSP